MSRAPVAFTSRSPRGKLDAKILREAGILRDPSQPAQALERARTLARHGRVREARSLIHPHMRRACGLDRARMAELLARCAMAGAGGNWRELLEEALRGYEESGYLRGLSRTQRKLGEMLLSAGQLGDAEQRLLKAKQAYEQLDNAEGAALTRVLQARVYRRSGRLTEALAQADRAVTVLDELGRTGSASLARLERARLRAMRGDHLGAAHDLVDADHQLSAQGDATARMRARLMRAEILLRQGGVDRVATAMRRLVEDLGEIEDAHVRAWAHSLLGESLTLLDPQRARRELARARHLYEDLGHTYNVVSCDIHLVRVEHALRLDPRPRLDALARQSLEAWPLLAAELLVVRASLDLEPNGTKLREELLAARRFALASGNRFLAKEVTRALDATDALGEDSDALTPVQLPPEESTTHAALYRALSTGIDGQPTRPERLERIARTDDVGPRARPVFAALLASSVARSPIRASLRRPMARSLSVASTDSRVA
ncbi:MAG: tetratricopeptide repeat protein [Myxococcota bacterium]